MNSKLIIGSKIKVDKKEIINNLLKKLLEYNLSRLEKRNITEIKDFKSLSNEAEKMILSLEEMSHTVRKEICVQRQKYINDENKSKNTSKNKKVYPKSPKAFPKSHSTRRLSKLKRINSKSYEKYEALQTETNNHQNKSQILPKSKSKKKVSSTKDGTKMTNNITTGRKTVGNIPNNFNKTGLIPHSKPKRPVSPFITAQDKDKFSKTMGTKPSSINQRKASAQRKKSTNKDITSKTEKITKKSASKYGKNNKNEKSNIKTNTNINNIKDINLLDKIESNSLDDSRIKVLDVFRQSQKGDNLNIKTEVDNKNTDNKCQFLQSLSKEFGKVGTIKMDDKILRDSLLVTNNLEGEVSINMDDLIRGSTLKEVELENNKEKKIEQNDTDNNNLKDSKKKELNSSANIYNKLKRSKITFLEGVNDLDLIFKDSKIEDIDLNLNKDVDLNTTEISDHISLEEKFETNLDVISRYLDIRDICNLMLINKECFKTLVDILESKTEISIDLLEEEIKKLKEINPNIAFDTLKKKPIKLSVNSMRAISLLNSSSGNNILKLTTNELNKKEIVLIYTLYFVAIGKKKEIANLLENEKIEYMQNYFKKNNTEKNNFGRLIEAELNGKIFDDNIISSLYTLSKKQLNIISPNYFQKINKDIAIFVFVIKDILEQIGLLGSQFIKPDKEFILLNARLQTNKVILKELNEIEDKIYYS